MNWVGCVEDQLDEENIDLYELSLELDQIALELEVRWASTLEADARTSTVPIRMQDQIHDNGGEICL